MVFLKKFGCEREKCFMKKKICTLTVALPGDLKNISIPVPQALFYFLSFATVIGLLTLTIFVVNFTRMVVKVREFNQLRSEVTLLKAANQNYEMLTNQLSEKLSLLEMLANKVSSAAGFERKPTPPKNSDDKGEKGKAPTQHSLLYDTDEESTQLTPAEYLDILSTDANRLESRFQNLDHYYDKFNFKLAHLPTIWPTQGMISDRFGGRDEITAAGESSYHTGIDISCPRGTPVFAAADGNVFLTGRRSDYGNLIILDHGQGISTWYAHLSSVFVAPGQLVKKGMHIGAVGTTGRSTGPHLHYEVRRGSAPINPMFYLAGLR
jgi:murein DD-endopeptidase MepM/ murein hydrolase activator NlpD